MTDRKSIFKQGQHYLPKHSFMVGPSTFIAGERLLFKTVGYSHYDGGYVYEFHSETDGQEKYWLLGDKEAPSVWQDFFRSGD